MAPRISKTFLWAPWSPQIVSRGARDSPQQRSRRPHREAEGPAKPPRPLKERLSAYPLTILITESKKKASKRHRQGISEATSGLSSSMFCHSFLLVMFFFCFSFFSFALSVSFIIIMGLRLSRGLRLELRLRLRMRLGVGLCVRLRRRLRRRLRLSQSLRT